MKFNYRQIEAGRIEHQENQEKESSKETWTRLEWEPEESLERELRIELSLG